jgi:endonuclease/exonuclease/phosphatase family metal-dependent hydrolase
MVVDYHRSMPRPMPRLVRVAVFLCVVFVAAARPEASNQCVPRPVAHSAAVTSDYDRPTSADSVTVASLNIAGQPQIGDALAAWTDQRSVDILLLQEVGHPSIDGEAFVAALSGRLGFHAVYAPADLVSDVHTQGLAIVSRYPLDQVRVDALKHHRLRFKSRCRIALAATTITTNGPLRMVNIHLDTRINSRNRIAQLAPVLDALHRIDGPQIIGGDFNTMNIDWFRTMWPFPYVQRQSAAVRALLASGGFHTPFTGGSPTFTFLGLPLTLDWLYLKHLEALDWSVDTVRLTDHRGVRARVTLRPRAVMRDIATSSSARVR